MSSRERDELHTGWLVRPGYVRELADAVDAVLKLDETAYEALGARARQFAEFMFSPQICRSYSRGLYLTTRTRLLTSSRTERVLHAGKAACY